VKITALEVDGYGVWSDLKLDEMSDGLNVFFGPNEAGKTTLMQFVRSMLYGFSPSRRHYFPPLRGGRPGGSIATNSANGRFRISRHADDEAADDTQGKLLLAGADGIRQGEHLLKVLLSNVDEPIFNNVFAIGLHELQELGTLSDTEAASLLYNLSAGLDRISLVEVMDTLEASRNRILAADGRPSRVAELLEQREKLRAEIEELSTLGDQYGRLASRRDQLDREVARLQEDNDRIQLQSKVIETAVGLRDRWRQRAELDEQLAALGPMPAMPDGAVDRFDEVNARLQRHQQRVEQYGQRRGELRSEAAGLEISEALQRQAFRIEALGEQETWIVTLKGQVAELEIEIAELRSRSSDDRKRFGLDEAAQSGELPVLSRHMLATLRRPAKALRQSRERLEEATAQQTEARETAESASQQIETALAARGARGLVETIETAGNFVAQLRRRVHVDQRLDEMDRHQTELEDRSRALLERQLMPAWVLFGLGGMFALGVMLVMAGLFLPASVTGTLGWALALLGLGGSAAAGITKLVIDQSSARQLNNCQKQIGMLQLQIKQAKQEREELDGQLPQGNGSLTSRLEAAEAELASLEELMPLDTRRQAARQEAETASALAARAESELTDARRHWRRALSETGLPPGFSPKQVRNLFQHSDRIAETHRHLQRRREELEQRRRELDALTDRISQISADVGLTGDRNDPIEQLHELTRLLAEQETRIARRRELRDQARRIRRKRAKHEAAILQLKYRRSEFLSQAGADNEQQFRERALRIGRADQLRQQRESVQAEITVAIGGHCTEQAVAEQLAEGANQQLEARWDSLQERLPTIEKQLQQQFEQRGQLNEQVKTLAADNRPAAKRLELSLVEERLKEAVGRWQVVAVTSRILETIRETFERERQPETLQEASGYLERLTQGRYCRVWTPLGEDVLRVDDADGESLPVEVLSRGTREQLFLCLRLALASCYARRGIRLPLVLDDVLVNFDTDRAKAAAAVLRDVAAEGQQLLVFTCHEHIYKLFKSLKVQASRLPDNSDMQAVVSVHTVEAKPTPRPKPKTVKPPPPVEPEEAPEEAVVAKQRNIDKPWAKDELDEEPPLEEAEVDEEEADEEELEDELEDDEYEDDEADEWEEYEEEEEDDEPGSAEAA